MTVVPKHTRHEMSGINGADTGAARADALGLAARGFRHVQPAARADRTRGLDHGVVALCQLSYIRLGARRTVHQ
jgi:hypothetical protein